MTASEQDITITGAGVARRGSRALGIVRRSGITLMERMPGAARATGAGMRGTTSALQHLPDSKLRWLAAGSIGLAAGFHLAGAPRLARVAGVAPALFMGAAMASRATAPVDPTAVTAHAAGAGSSPASSPPTT
jgi:hypothetical protein